jgi:CYTH domain-containing protein
MGAIASAKFVIMQPEDVCLLTAGWHIDMYRACVVWSGVVFEVVEYWKTNNKVFCEEVVLFSGTFNVYDEAIQAARTLSY